MTLWVLARLLPVTTNGGDVPAGEGTDAVDGLIPDLDVHLPGLAPEVVRFYAETVHHQLIVAPRWRMGLRWVGALWGHLVGRRWGQLELPCGPAEALDHDVLRADRGRWWVVRYRRTGRVLLRGRYEVHRAGILRVGFPLPGGAWVVDLDMACDRGVLVLRSVGQHLVPASGRARRLPGLREEVRVAPAPTGARAVHRVWVLGVPVVTLTYELRPTGTA